MSYAKKLATKILMEDYLNLMPKGDKQAEIRAFRPVYWTTKSDRGVPR